MRKSNKRAAKSHHCLPSGNGRLQRLLSGNNAQIVNLTHGLVTVQSRGETSS